MLLVLQETNTFCMKNVKNARNIWKIENQSLILQTKFAECA
jgi:hypothetical protein